DATVTGVQTCALPIYETIVRKLTAHADEIRDAIVRVVIKTTPQHEALLRDDEIRKALSEAAYVASVSREVDAPRRTRLGEQAIEIGRASCREREEGWG